MAANIPPPDRWTINPHFAKGNFLVDACVLLLFAFNRVICHLKQNRDKMGFRKVKKRLEFKARHENSLPRRRGLVRESVQQLLRFCLLL